MNQTRSFLRNNFTQWEERAEPNFAVCTRGPLSPPPALALFPTALTGGGRNSYRPTVNLRERSSEIKTVRNGRREKDKIVRSVNDVTAFMVIMVYLVCPAVWSQWSIQSLSRSSGSYIERKKARKRYWTSVLQLGVFLRVNRRKRN